MDLKEKNQYKPTQFGMMKVENSLIVTLQSVYHIELGPI